jgi:glycosyltransferase involved in cell wall biosynthesis
VRIVYYVHAWPPDKTPNGVGSAVAALLPAMRAAGHAVEILSFTGGAADVPPSGAWHVEAERWRAAAHPARKLRDRLFRDLSFYDSTPASIAARVCSVPALKNADIFEMEETFGWCRTIAERIAPLTVVRLHGPYFLTGAAARDGTFTTGDRSRIRREGAAIAGAAAVTAPSRFVLDAVRQRYELPLADAAVIPNAVRPVDDAALWRLEAADRDEILFVGRFDRIKGADTLLRAFAVLAQKHPRLKLTFAGPVEPPMLHEGRSHDHREMLRALMPAEAAARVQFLGPTPPSGLPELRRRAYVTIVCSRIEMFPNVLLEALSAGSPVVAAAVGGMPEMARDGVEALFVAPEDPHALAAAVSELIVSPDLAARLGAGGRRRALGEYAPERTAALTAAFYQAQKARFSANGRKAAR